MAQSVKVILHALLPTKCITDILIKKISSHHTPIIVTYTADKINGFNAVVEKAGVAHHAAPVAKVAHAPYIAHSPYVAHAPAVVAPAYHGYGLLH